MSQKSLWIYRILLALSAVVFLGVLIWVAMRFFEPAPAVELPATKSRVVFNPSIDIRSNPLFEGLKAFFGGAVEPGILGKPIPFVAPSSTLASVSGSTSLATGEELPLAGAHAVDLTRAPNGAMLVLLSGTSNDGTVFEVRSFGTDGSVQSISSWRSTGETGLDPVRLAQAQDGTLWLGSATGRLGTLDAGSAPLWKPSAEVQLFAGAAQLLFDAASRLWVTDGFAMYLRNGGSLTPVDLYGSMTETDRTILANQLTQVPDSAKPLPLEGPDGLLKAALVPDRLTALADGGMMVNTGYAAIRLPSSASAPPVLVNTLATSSLPIAVAPNGDVWAERFTDRALVRLWATGTRSYVGVPAPTRALAHPQEFVSDLSTLYVLDYSPTSTVVWSTGGTEWLAQAVAASGTLPNDVPVHVEVDGAGNLWAIMSQGGLVRILRPAFLK